MVPLMTSFAKMTQHQAVGTSSAAVAGTGLAGMASFASAGAVDLGAAAALASTAMLTAKIGATLTKRFNAVALARAFACFQVFVGPLVIVKATLVKSRKVTGIEGSGTVPMDPAPPPEGSSDDAEAAVVWSMPDAARTRELGMLAATGLVAGVASGLFGIGGGLVITPALCLMTDMPHVMVLGTTLASMIPPSLVSAVTHRQMGNVIVSAVGPLVAGSAIGAASAGQVAVRMPEEPLQWMFCTFLMLSGGRKLWTLRGM